MSALCLQYWRGGIFDRGHYLAAKQDGRELLRQKRTIDSEKHEALRIAKRNWGTPYSTYFQKVRWLFICASSRLTLKVMWGRSTCLCVCVCERFKRYFFAGREAKGKEKWAHTTTSLYGYSTPYVHSTICMYS